MMMARLRSPVATLGLLALVAGSIAQPAHAQSDEPTLHEYLPPDPKEDLDLATQTPAGLPAAVQTPSGTITPPDIRTNPEPGRIYHKARTNQDTYHPDRDTRRPNVENYDDPFTPTLTPFKRMHAFDAVRANYGLYVRDKKLRPVVVGGKARDGDDRFFGDMMIQLRAGDPVRLPSVGPAARLLTLLTRPSAEVTIWRDGADNWFVRSDTAARVRMVTELAIERDAFSSEFADVSWRALPQVPLQPHKHRAAFKTVASAIGLSRGTMSPREVVAKMVAYFRSFGPSRESPDERGDIYLDLALSKKGVCRHRAFAFLITALNIGIPTRFVHNEAHAWVEVRDNRLWHRIDLGGAALNLADDPNLNRPPHVPPPDPFAWPSGRDSGSDLAHRQRADALADRNSSDPNAKPSPSASASGGVDPLAPPDPSQPVGPALPETELTVDTIDHDVFRGLPLRLKGRATSEGKPCAHLRVDVVILISGENTERRLGSLSTDDRGMYDGAVVLPRALPIGDHELVIVTPGGKRCGMGQAR